MERRSRDVEEFFSNRKAESPSPTYNSARDGAGTFSDGKLNTGTKDARARKVLEEFAASRSGRRKFSFRRSLTLAPTV